MHLAVGFSTRSTTVPIADTNKSQRGDPRQAAAARTGHEVVGYPWASSILRTQSPSAAQQVERIEADAKFFRSLTVATIAAPYLYFTRVPSSLVWFVVAGVLGLLLASLFNEIADWNDSKLVRARRTVDRPARLLDIAFVFGAAGVALLLYVATSMVLDARGSLAVAYGLMWVVFALRFAQQRWQRNKTAYEMATAAIAAVGQPNSS